MKIIIFCLVMLVFVILIWLRMKKYRDKLEPNAKIIVCLINKLRDK
ncbi:MAG: hypothetical protein KAU12_02850 [Candidatus Omnitrophica bacterium]|nr:hypothetical protein [Candidatus Omnitrophota bacterium]